VTQSQFLFGGLIVAFLIWIITKGELNLYLTYFTVSNQSGATAGEGITGNGFSSPPTGTASNPLTGQPESGTPDSSTNSLLQSGVNENSSGNPLVNFLGGH
jgi:hypothetical protein